MKSFDKIPPLNDELPVDYADRLGLSYSAFVTQTHKKNKGQFLTPSLIARFMGNMAKSDKIHISILDPSSGTLGFNNSNYVLYQDDGSGTSKSFPITYGSDYDAWIHTKALNGSTSNGVHFPPINCLAPAPIPDLKVSTYYWNGIYNVNNADGTVETYYDSLYLLSWDTIANATSCTIDDVNASVTSGSKTENANSLSQTFTLTCLNASGQTGSDSVTLTVPFA